MRLGDVEEFDRYARVYDVLVPSAKRSKLRAGLALADRPVDRVLDVGGGPGRAAQTLDADLRVVVDPAVGMLQQARTHGLETVCGDGSRLPVQSASVDAVVVSDALHHIADQRATLREAHRVLRPGGVLVVREFDPTTLHGRTLETVEHLWGFQSAFTSPAALCADLDEVGLDATILDESFGYTVAGVRPTENGSSKAGESE